MNVVTVTGIYRSEISTTCFHLNERVLNVITSNIMVLHHKQSQTVKIKVNRYTNIYIKFSYILDLLLIIQIFI